MKWFNRLKAEVCISRCYDLAAFQPGLFQHITSLLCFCQIYHGKSSSENPDSLVLGTCLENSPFSYSPDGEDRPVSLTNRQVFVRTTKSKRLELVSFCCSLLEQVGFYPSSLSVLPSSHHRQKRKEEETCRGCSRYPHRWLYPADKRQDPIKCQSNLLYVPLWDIKSLFNIKLIQN